MPVKARGKVRREKIEEDEQAIQEFEKQATKIVKREATERQTISSTEIVLSIRDTLNRLYQEFDPRMGDQERDANADENARQILRTIKHGIPENPGHGTRITEQEQDVPLCANCK